MKKRITLLLAVLCFINVGAQERIKLEKPDLERGFNVMKALNLRASATKYNPEKLSLADLSDLCWAADGINRPASGKRTAPSAMNAQDVDVYVAMEEGIYIYDHKEHSLNLKAAGDYRKLLAGRQQNVAEAPVILLLVSDISRFRGDNTALKMEWAAMDAGIVSQNISVFCSGVGLVTRCRAFMEKDQLKQILKLTDTQILMLNHPVSK
jgi:SagB-type dehydrogenase family enzyme